MTRRLAALLGCSALLVAACADNADEPSPETRAETSMGEAAAPGTGYLPDPDRTHPERVLWGDTHVHTGWSADAGMDGAITDPEDAFRFARGETVKSNTGQDAKLIRPLDWMVITDHSDGMGVVNEVVAGNEELLADPVIAEWVALSQKGEEGANEAKLDLISRQSNGTLPALLMDPKWMESAWKSTIEIADRYDAPGTFSALIGYEWTVNADGGNNLHRNVIFRDDASKAGQVLPLTTFVTMDPEDLWEWMAEYETKTGGRVLAIPHNGNLSNGRMYEETRFDGSPLTREYALTRQRWEPLMELTQIKGQSESHSSLSPTDEFAAWDVWDKGNLNGEPKQPGQIRTEYWREALKSGLRLEAELGANPFKYGAEAATDTHTGLSTAEENNFWGKFKTVEPGPERMTRPVTTPYLGWEQAAAGYTGVWATANTREAIWDALKRKEAYGTTGPRITLRFFGGFGFSEADMRDYVTAGYARGVPMGGDLSAAPAGSAPGFLIAVMKDPEGANLDRVQVVKGWLDDDGTTHERIYDVVWSGDRTVGADGKLPAVGNTVDLSTATFANTIGATELEAYWQDPDFDPAQRAVYYVRVLEIPTPRWTAYDQVRYGVQAPEGATLIHQERAFSSPIWYTP